MSKRAFATVLLLAVASVAYSVAVRGPRVAPASEVAPDAAPNSDSPPHSEIHFQEPRFGIDSRVPWTTSRIRGSPEPPPPYRNEPAFPNLKFKNPLAISNAPGTDRLLVVEQTGKLYSIPTDPDCATPDLLLDLPNEIRTIDRAGTAQSVGDVYSLTFHPKFEQNRYCYICYVLNGKTPGEQLADGTRVSRFRVTDTDPPRCDPASEQVIITWLSGGHNGGCLAFGPDGMLYISTGDATPPSPPDGLDAGQDMTKLLSGVLRIDVDHPDGGRPYSIPPDNPFVSLEGVRPEKWAYGFRNPWKMSFDRATGDLWLGDVGSTLGPDLTRIASKYNRAQLLESILEPSKLIDPKYVMYLVETSQGRVLTGLLVERTGDAIVLRDAQDQTVRIPAKDVQQLVPQRQSIMPELLLREMTAEQVADLLEFLDSLK